MLADGLRSCCCASGGGRLLVMVVACRLRISSVLMDSSRSAHRSSVEGECDFSGWREEERHEIFVFLIFVYRHWFICSFSFSKSTSEFGTYLFQNMCFPSKVGFSQKREERREKREGDRVTYHTSTYAYLRRKTVQCELIRFLYNLCLYSI